MGRISLRSIGNATEISMICGWRREKRYIIEHIVQIAELECLKM